MPWSGNVRTTSTREFAHAERPDQLLALHATAEAVTHHPPVGLLTATGVEFTGDRYRFAQGLSHVLLGVPFRPLEHDAHCRLEAPPSIARSVRARSSVTLGARLRSELILIGDHQPYSIAYAADRRAAIDFIYLDPDWLRLIAIDLCGTANAHVQLASDLKLADGVLEPMARSLLPRASAGRTAGTLERDCRAHLLAATLLERHALALPRRRVRARPLNQRSLERVMEYVEAHLLNEGGLAAMAGIAGLSTHHFLRSFRLATGLTPHQYLIAARIRRASVLLRETSLAITDIAAETGFASQAHMTQLFRRHLGTTPATWRAKG